MASTPTDPRNIKEKIEDTNLELELKDSFMGYALSVIHARALPDARDGLKPVQRRIIFQMFEMGLRPDRPFVKSARIVGDVMGKLHPHGDSAIYEALVRLAQDFSLNLPLVEGHGNFGSLDDSPAAARYTEARPSKTSLYLTQGINEDTVDFVPNYDNKLQQPAVLPGAIPNLLVNGTTGIAVGMATNMPTHNITEVLHGALELLNNPEITIKELMNYIPGPDFPSGGIIINSSDLQEIYETGRGTVIMRAKTKIDNINPRTKGIIITELPFGVGPERLIARLKSLQNNKKIEGISYFKDLTDRKNGTKIVIAIKSSFDPAKVLHKLWSLTPLQENFGVNNVALVNFKPETMNLKMMLEVWLNHRKEVLKRRTNFRLKKNQERLHLVEGLLKAILDIDKTIKIIRESDDDKIAKAELINFFKIDDIQAEYILELKLRRITKLSTIELENEKKELLKEIDNLTEILSSEKRFKLEITKEIQETLAQFDTPRKTVIANVNQELEKINHNTPTIAQSNTLAQTSSAQVSSTTNTSTPSSATSTPNSTSSLSSEFALESRKCMVLLSASMLIGVVIPKDTPERAGENPEEENSIESSDKKSKRYSDDAIKTIIKTKTDQKLGVITNLGNVYTLEVAQLHELEYSQSFQGMKGMPKLDLLFDLESGEKTLNLFQFPDDPKNSIPVALMTKEGIVKRVQLEESKSNRPYSIIKLQDNDRVVDVYNSKDTDYLVAISSDASLLVFPSEKVRPQGKSGQGMLGMKLSDNAKVIAFKSVPQIEGNMVVTFAKNDATLGNIDAGNGKTTPLSEFPITNRGGKGVRSQKFLKNESELSFAFVGNEPLGALNSRGIAVDIPPLNPKRDASGSKLEKQITSVGWLIN